MRRLPPVICAVAALLAIAALLPPAAEAVVGPFRATTLPNTPVFADGFESGDLSSWTGSAGAFTVQQQELLDGTWAARGISTGARAFASKTLDVPLPELYYRVWFKVISDSTRLTLMRLRTPRARTSCLSASTTREGSRRTAP